MLAPLLVTLAILPQGPPGDTKLTGSDERAFREVVTTALREAESPSVADFNRFRMRDLVAAVRKGPLFDKTALEPRVVAGVEETFEDHSGSVSGYSFEAGGHVYNYMVSFPRKYDPKEAWPVLLDPGHGTGSSLDQAGKAGMLDFYRQGADANGGRDWIVVRTEIIEQIGAGGVFEPKPDDEVARVFDAFFRDALSRFHVDLSRVYVAGISQTGFWAWYLGTVRPCRFAGIVPGSAVTWAVDPWIENVRNMAVFVVHGEIDPKCPVAQPRAAVRRLARIGTNVAYKEIAGGGHDGRVFGHVGDGLAFVGENVRDPYPKRVSKGLANLMEGGWAYWLRVDALEREDSGKAVSGREATGGVDAEIDGQTIRLYSEGVKAVTLGLASEMLDLGKEIEVIWNGKKVHAGKVEQSVETLVELAAQKVDWLGTFEAKLELEAP